MIILLYGKDTYRSGEKLREIVVSYQQKHQSGLNLKFFSVEDSLEDLSNCKKQISIFDEKKLMVIKEVFREERIRKEILEKYQEMAESEDIFLFYEETDIKKTDKLFKKLNERKTGVMIQEFAPLASKKLFNWIEKEFFQRGVKVNREVVAYIAQAGGEDMWKIKNEIEKLSLYKKEIKKEDVSFMVKTDAQTDIFKTVDAVARKEEEKALLLLYDHLKKGDSPFYLFSMLGYQFRNLLMVSDLLKRNLPYKEAEKRSGLHSFVFKKSYEQVKKFSPEKLKMIYYNLCEMDLKTKTGQIDPVLALHLFLFNC